MIPKSCESRRSAKTEPSVRTKIGTFAPLAFWRVVAALSLTMRSCPNVYFHAATSEPSHVYRTMSLRSWGALSPTARIQDWCGPKSKSALHMSIHQEFGWSAIELCGRRHFFGPSHFRRLSYYLLLVSIVKLLRKLFICPLTITIIRDIHHFQTFTLDIPHSK